MSKCVFPHHRIPYSQLRDTNDWGEVHQNGLSSPNVLEESLINYFAFVAMLLLDIHNGTVWWFPGLFSTLPSNQIAACLDTCLFLLQVPEFCAGWTWMAYKASNQWYWIRNASLRWRCRLNYSAAVREAAAPPSLGYVATQVPAPSFYFKGSCWVWVIQYQG